ncbi:CST complex subunit CTC1 [Tiliqua scincoides]|uniref:CST complex subunit CTC1 n=1 Tax=Tiliqua scincoides TaxID=71010 RepID=UPI0034618F53
MDLLPAGAAGSVSDPFSDQWQREARDFARRVLCRAGGSDEDAAWQGLKRVLSQCSGEDLPLGYSLISISDLQSQQHLPCCSHLTWSSDEFRQWASQHEGVLLNQNILQETRLILCGYLTDEGLGEEKEKLVNGSLYVQDNTGILPCELLCFKLEWLGCLLLFPSWSYIPHAGKRPAGYVEILADPVQVMPGPEKIFDILPVFYPGQATQLLRVRAQCKKTTKLNVAGELCRLSTVLYIHSKTFFFLFLKCFSSPSCVPVLVQKTPQLVWHHALQLGHKYVLTALRVSCLKASGRRVFTTSSSSRLLPYHLEQVMEQLLDSTSEPNPVVPASSVDCMELNSSLELPEEEERQVTVRKSKVVSYIGTITQVLNTHAGLYELDKKFTLCLGYQQLLNSGRGLRPGTRVELQDVHLIQKPLAIFPFVLGACLRSAVVIKSFSRHSTLHQPIASFGNIYVQLLLRYNLNLPLYLWMVSVLETFELRFCRFSQCHPSLFSSQHQALEKAEKFIVPILNSLVPPRKQARDIHQEILAEKHRCPLEQYQILEPPCQIPSFSLLYSELEKRCWESFDPLQQLSSTSDIHNLGVQELNRSLAWSYCILSAENFQPRLVLLGVLECSSSGCLQLQDASKTLPCVIFHRDGRLFADTSLIGCLLEIEIFQLVMERFLQSEFPSWQQLVTQKHVKEKKTRFYAQFYFEDVKILHAPEKRFPTSPTIGKETSSGIRSNCISVPELKCSGGKGSNLRKTRSDTNSPECSKGRAEEASFVSRLFWVSHKEGLMRRNYQQISEGKDKDGQATQLCFQALVQWMGKAELGEIGGQEELKISAPGETSEAQQKVLLLFLGKSLRWFPLLHPLQLYHLIIPLCSDLDVFDRLCFSQAPENFSKMLSSSMFLPVPDSGHLHHVNQPSQLASTTAGMEQELFSIAEVLSPSFTRSLVSFSGEIVERTMCESVIGKKQITDCSVQLLKGNFLPWDYTVKLSISPTPGSSFMLDVYVEATFLPYLWGLLPGARILFKNVQRKISRFRNVYCTYVASSCMHMLTPAPLHTSDTAGAASSLSVGYLCNVPLQSPNLFQVTCHLTCVLSLSLHWICSLCKETILKEESCNQCGPSCLSHIGVSKASARILVEDGTCELVASCKNQQVREVLGLSPEEWDVVQKQARSKGGIYISHKEAGTGPGTTDKPEDLLTWYLRSLCRSPLVCRSITMTFKLDRKPPKGHATGSRQLRRFVSNDTEFLSKYSSLPNLLCLNIQEAT